MQEGMFTSGLTQDLDTRVNNISEDVIVDVICIHTESEWWDLKLSRVNF